MVSGRKKRLPSVEDDTVSALTLKNKPSSTSNQRKQAKRKKVSEQPATKPTTPIASPSFHGQQLESAVRTGKPTTESHGLEKDLVSQTNSIEAEAQPEPEPDAEGESDGDPDAQATAQAEALPPAQAEAVAETEAGLGAGTQVDTAEEVEEQEARERMFAEFTEEYYDIVEELPLELDRNFTLMGELEASIEECKQELREDLKEYLNFAKRTIDESDSFPLSAKLLIEEEDIANQLLVLAQPMLWGAVPMVAYNVPPPPSSIPDHLKSLLSEISKKMCRLHKLSRDKLNLAETVYEGLDRHLKRLDADLEKYQDLEDEDEDAERRQEREQAHEPEFVNLQSVDLEIQSPRKICSPQPENTCESIALAPMAAPKSMKRSVNKPHPRHPDPAAQSNTQTGLISTPSSQLVSFQSDSDAPLALSDKTPPRIASSRPAEQQLKAPRTPRLGSLATQSASGTLVLNLPDITEPTGHAPTALVPAPQISPGAGSSSRAFKTRRPTNTTTSSSRRVSSGSRKRPDVEASIGPVFALKEKKSPGDEEKLYCYCKQVSYGDMVGCDNVDCEGGEWFHLECTGLQQLPDAVDWYCDLCVEKLIGKEGVVVKKRKK